MLQEHLGQLPLLALEEPDEINRFKTESEYAEDVPIQSRANVRPSRNEHVAARTLTGDTTAVPRMGPYRNPATSVSAAPGRRATALMT